MQFKNIALVGKHQSEAMIEHILHIAQYLIEIKMNVFIDCHQEDDSFINKNVNIGKLVDWLGHIDLVIVIGGDGTLLSVARQVIDFKIPIVGINQGKLGFMTDVVVEEMIEVIENIILKSNYTIESRTLLHANVLRDNKNEYHSVALNDVVISRGAIGNMIEFDIQIDGQFVLSQKSDGIIFATPTGSTAYSLAAGGPILHPNANVFSVVPICPQSLTNRPFVTSDDSVIEFILARENATQIHFDGQECFDLQLNDRVFLKKYPEVIRLIHPRGYNYYRTLRKKLEWSKRVS
jgi:NAD+ kinase